MTDQSKKRPSPAAGKKRPRLEKLELNKETVQDLTEGEAEDVEGGALKTASCISCGGDGCTVGCGVRPIVAP